MPTKSAALRVTTAKPWRSAVAAIMAWSPDSAQLRRRRHPDVPPRSYSAARLVMTPQLTFILPPQKTTSATAGRMKKPTPIIFERQRRLARYRACERDSRIGRRRKRTSVLHVPPGERIKAPENFDLLRGGAIAVVKFLRAIATTVLVQRIPTRLDFRFTRAFSPSATILLFAEIDRIVNLSALPKPVTIVDPQLRRPREVLKQIGIYQLTQDRCDIVPGREDVVYWCATKGVDQSGTNMELLKVVADHINQEHALQIEVKGVWRGVNEAVCNSVDHAYSKPRADGFAGLPNTKWWMFTQLRDGLFTVVVCDLGCGYRATINETLPERFIASVASLFIGSNRDALAIRTAMQHGRSGTGLTERGRGSRDALSVLERHGDGQLTLVSNTGLMRYTAQQHADPVVEEANVGIDIRGTIIWWNLPLKEIEK